MYRHSMSLLGIAAAGLTAGLVMTAVADEEEGIAFSDVPPAVQRTIVDHLDGGVVLEIDRETEDGHTVYDVEIGEIEDVDEITIGSDGQFLGEEDEEEEEDEEDEDEGVGEDDEEDEDEDEGVREDDDDDDDDEDDDEDEDEDDEEDEDDDDDEDEDEDDDDEDED